jgi:predicted HTH domain antitoxin
MTIELPDVKIGSEPLTPEQARIEIACGLYAGRHVSMGRAAKIAGIPYTDFMHELGRRGICLNYGVEDFEHDMRVLDELAAKKHAA